MVRLTLAAPAQDHGGASQPQSKSRETYATVGEAAEGRPPMPPVVPSDSFEVWNDLAGPKPPHRVYEDLDNLVEWANNPSQPGIRTPNSERNTQRLSVLSDDGNPPVGKATAYEGLDELISRMGQVANQMRETSEVFLDKFETVSSLLKSTLREVESFRHDKARAMASSLTTVEANSQEILKSNQLLGIEIRCLATRIASGLTDLGNQINRDTTRTPETTFEQATTVNGASLQAIVDLLQNRRDVTVDPEHW